MEKRKSEKLDLSKYIGAKKSDGECYRVVKAILTRHEKYGYSLKMETEPIELTAEDKKKMSDKVICASVIFKVGFDEAKNEIFVVEGSKLDKFMTSKNVDFQTVPSDLKEGQDADIFWGIPVNIQTKDNGFLTFV